MQFEELITNDPEEAGRLWLSGELKITNFMGMKLNPKQAAFVNDVSSRYLLGSGGFASGKTTAFIIKLWLLCWFFPNNRILLGRKTRADIESAVLQDIIDIFPPGTYEHKVGPGHINFKNGSQIIFYGLDVMQSGNAQEMKKAIQKIKGLNLGGVFIDQLEEIEFAVWEHLGGRLRRDVPLQQFCATTNPANHWSYKYFIKKVHPISGRPLEHVNCITMSMLDNKDNLSDSFIEDQMGRDDIYKKTYVYGVWDESTMVEGMVFDKGYVDQQEGLIKKPLRETNGLKIYEEPRDHDYQVGIDPSTGAEDPCFVSVADKTTGEVVATYTGYVPVNVQVKKALELCTLYTRKSEPLAIPEVNGVGQAFIEEFKKVYNNIYVREVFNKRDNAKTSKLGFYTTFANKQSLIEHFKMLLSKNFPRVFDRQIVEQLRTFIYSNEAKKQGAGGAPNTHDDAVMATLFAFWNVDGQARSSEEDESEFVLYNKDYE